MLRIAFLITFIAIIMQVSCDYAHYPNVKLQYKFHRQPQKWVDARNICRAEGGALAMPQNVAELAILNKIFSEYPASTLTGITHPDFFLLNFHDMFKEGEYITDKGVPIQYYYHTWAGGQPDNAGGNENCGSLHRSGGLNDFPCHIPSVFICQKPFKGDLLAHFKCLSPDPAYMYSKKLNKCYKLHLDPRIWADARAICRAEGGNLAIINNKEEEEYLVSLFVKPEDRVNHVQHKDFALLGFHDIFKENYFVTVDGEDLSDVGYLNWAGGQPDNAGGNENCGSMYISGGINDFPCGAPAVFFCETEANTFAAIDP